MSSITLPACLGGLQGTAHSPGGERGRGAGAQRSPGLITTSGHGGETDQTGAWGGLDRLSEEAEGRPNPPARRWERSLGPESRNGDVGAQSAQKVVFCLGTTLTGGKAGGAAGPLAAGSLHLSCRMPLTRRVSQRLGPVPGSTLLPRPVFAGVRGPSCSAPRRPVLSLERQVTGMASHGPRGPSEPSA